VNDDFGPLPRLHPRERIVNKARAKLSETVSEVVKDLTEGEALSVVNEELHRFIGGVAKYVIRDERHPGEPDKPGGWE
jgi:hypothetical protein